MRNEKYCVGGPKRGQMHALACLLVLPVSLVEHVYMGYVACVDPKGLLVFCNECLNLLDGVSVRIYGDCVGPKGRYA
jgi:hypothetical protein